ncbi:MAG: hypothetical protein LBR13_00545, partial [Dysgonamonadaceae bacterium]|nr:hypothetical protein [Dysgonamonadaceae bacterium]
MMKAFFFSFFVFFCASLAINAQYIAITRESFPNIDTVIPKKYSELLSDTNATALRTTWVATRPGDLWFFSLEGGINWPRSENWRELYWKDRFRNLTLGFNFGRYFTPVWGLRLETTFSREHMFSPDPRLYPPNGGESPWYIGQYHTNELGTMSSNSYVVNDTPERAEFIYERFLKGEPEYIGRRGTQGFYYDITYVGITIDFLLNLRNFTSHYNPKARWNPVMFIGVGYAHTFKERERTAVNSIMNRMGFQWNLRIHKHWNLYLTLPECIMVPEVWDRR